MKKLLFGMLAGMLLMVSSCQSDELSVGGNDATDGVTSGGKAVNFTYKRSTPSVRTHYNEDGDLSWSQGDMVRIISPAPEDSNDAHQNAHYVFSDGEDNTSGSFAYVEESSPTGEILWHDAEEQHFYAYYPAESVGADPTTRVGAITDIDPVSGSAVYHVPADQSLTAGVIPSASEDPTHPLAYAVAVNKSVSTEEESPVQLQFHDFMNVLRVHVNNPMDKPVKGVKVSSIHSSTYLAGTVQVEFDNNSSHASLNNLICAIPAAGHGSASPTPKSNEVKAVAAAASHTLGIYYDLYLLPQMYVKNTLQVTVMIGNNDNPADDITKTITSDFAKGSIKQVRFNLPPEPDANPDYGIKMISIPGGTFEFGGATDNYSLPNAPMSPFYTPTAVLSNFKIGQTEVTQGQWEAVMRDAMTILQNTTHTKYKTLTNAGFAMKSGTLYYTNNSMSVSTGLTPTQLWPLSISSSPGGPPSATYGLGANYPAYYINRDHVRKIFIPILKALTGKNYGLPSETQWEYAARARNYSNDFAGATGDQWRKVAWFNNSDYSSNPADGAKHAQPVGRLYPNDFNLYDMSGNVAEMCEDGSTYRSQYPETIPIDYLIIGGYDSEYICRGGAYNSQLSVIDKGRFQHVIPFNLERYPWLGFRLVIFDGQYNTLEGY